MLGLASRAALIKGSNNFCKEGIVRILSSGSGGVTCTVKSNHQEDAITSGIIVKSQKHCYTIHKCLNCKMGLQVSHTLCAWLTNNVMFGNYFGTVYFSIMVFKIHN